MEPQGIYITFFTIEASGCSTYYCFLSITRKVMKNDIRNMDETDPVELGNEA